MPKILDDPLYQMLRVGKVQEFNQRLRAGESVVLKDSDFRNCDLRGLDAAGLDLSGCYFRSTDLRGIDFRQTNLCGASLHGAHISGCFFPQELHPAEIELSVVHGVRIRYTE